MSKNKRSALPNQVSSTARTAIVSQETSLLPAWLKNTMLHRILIVILGFVLYANTLTHEFTQDDAIVINENMFTAKGVEGIPGLLKYDTFYGFFKTEGKQKLVAGGRYRPFTPIMFAIENQIFGSWKKDGKGDKIKNPKGEYELDYPPFIGHFFNIIWYIITGIFMYEVLRNLLRERGEELALIVSLTATLIFMAHPIHTEAVANIKGRDEIIALLGSLAALYYMLKANDENNPIYNVIAAVVFFIGLMSKENAITFLAIIPLAFWFFKNKSLGQSLTQMIPLITATVLFLGIRTYVIGADMGGTPWELMNNPFLKHAPNQALGIQYVPYTAQERMATIFFTLGKYVQLLFAPITLSHDYYPYHIKTMTFADPLALLSLVLYIVMGAIAVVGFFRKSIPAFGILFYLLSLSIVSNVVFAIGTNMSERFVFMPSVGFCLAVCYLIYHYSKSVNITLVASLVVTVLFTYKTIDRNQVWKDNYTLFTTDIKNAPNSAKLQNSVGGELTTKGLVEKDPVKKKKMLLEAIEHLKIATKLHPNYRNAYLLMGNAYNYMQDYEPSAEAYKLCSKIDPEFADSKNNLVITYRDAGKYYGERGDLAKAILYLEKAYGLQPNNYETLRLLGVASAVSGNPTKALEWFQKSVEAEPKNAHSWWDLGTAYRDTKNAVKSVECYQKAKELNPNIEEELKKK